MRAGASNRLLLATFALLAAGSVGLKAAAGPPKDGLSDARPGEVEQRITERLRGHGFATAVEAKMERSSAVLGRRGACLISARDARGGAAFVAVFTRDASDIGPVRYLYRGGSYEAPPTVAMRLGRLESEFRSRLGLEARPAIPIALATSAGCGGATFGLEDVRIAA